MRRIVERTLDWKFFLSLALAMLVLFFTATAWQSTQSDRDLAKHDRIAILANQNQMLQNQDNLLAEISYLKKELRRSHAHHH